MIRFDHVTFGYEAERPVLRELSLEIPEGGRVCLTGASGQGKTTALRLLLGLEQPQSGTVIRPEGTRFSVVFQEDRLLPWKTALEDARCWLTELGLGGSLDALPETLSGGMKRRAALARALAHPFDVLVLDEALTGLDDAAKARCLAAIDRAVGPQKTLVMACHDPAEAAALAARTVPVA